MTSQDLQGFMRVGENATSATPIREAKRDGKSHSEYTICVIMDGDRLLLKSASRGISSGKWNFPGGKIEPNETKTESVHREVAEEAGIKLTGAFYHGLIDCYHGDDGVLTRVHIFSSRSFEGELRSSSEGEVKWFDRDKLPFEQMWKDVRVWLNHVYSNDEFEVTVKYNNKAGDNMDKVYLSPKQRQRARC